MSLNLTTLLLVLTATAVSAEEADRLIANASVRTTIEGRFGPKGERVPLEIFRVPDEHLASDVMARIATPACSSQLTNLPSAYPDLARPMVVDLDGDGRDEVLVVTGGNTVDSVSVLRVEGCHVRCVDRRGSSWNCDTFPVYARGLSGPGGMGGFCRRIGSGATEIVEVQHSAWERYDFTTEKRIASEHVEWRRRVFRLQEGELVLVSEDQGTTRINGDPSVPLVNHFECAGIRYPEGLAAGAEP